MDKKQGAAILIALAAVVGAGVFFFYQGMTPTTPEEFNEVDALFSELDDFLNFEDQSFDDNLGDIAGDWG